MFIQFAVSTAMLVLCVFIHGAGLFSLSRAIRSERTVERMQHVDSLSLQGAAFTLLVVLAIFVLHGIEIWLFALMYVGIGAIDTIENALYFSTISYSTVGYSDSHVTPEWRLLGPFESILGIVLLGWSTAFFFRMLGRIDPH